MPFFNGSGGGSGGMPTLSGNGAPSSGLGVEGQLYIDLLNSVLYGPKTSLGWGSGIHLTGADWAEITGKPATFTPSAHSHVVGDVSGLQSTLDGKAAASHTHAISDVSNLQATLNAKAALSHAHSISDVTGLQASLDGKQAAGSYATLVNGVVPSSQLPGFVDDVVEVTSLPGTGETGKIYVNTTTGKVYRWSGSSFVEIVGSPGSTDAVPEGSTNLYFTNTRALAAVQSALDGKASLSHTHTVSSITGLQALLDGKAALSHGHSISDISTLSDRLDLATTLTTPPSSDTAPGQPGQLAIDSTYLYGCVASNTWRRVEWTAYGSAAGGITISSQPSSQTITASSGTASITTESPVGTNNQIAGFYNNGSVVYATSAASCNGVHAKLVGSNAWSNISRMFGSSLIMAAKNAFGATADPMPYGCIGGLASFTVAAKRLQWYPDDVQSLALRTDKTTVAPGNGDWSGIDLVGLTATNSSSPTAGVMAMASSSTLLVAALVRGYFQRGMNYAQPVSGHRYHDFAPLAYTINGTSWSCVTLDVEAAVNDLIYNNGRWIAVGTARSQSDNTAVARAWYSTNGLSWTAAIMPAGTWLSVAAGNGKVVAVGVEYLHYEYYNGYQSNNAAWGPHLKIDDSLYNQTQKVVVSSDNGTTWAAVPNALPTIERWTKVVFIGGNVNRFFAFSTKNAVVGVSADGVTWDVLFTPEATTKFGCSAIEGDSVYIPAEEPGWDAIKVTASISSSGGTGSASFSVTATATSGTLYYQWQKSINNGGSYSDISGATSASVTVSGLTVADNGAKFRCKLTSGSVVVYSNAATLTVNA